MNPQIILTARSHNDLPVELTEQEYATALEIIADYIRSGAKKPMWFAHPCHSGTIQRLSEGDDDEVVYMIWFDNTTTEGTDGFQFILSDEADACRYSTGRVHFLKPTNGRPISTETLQ